MDASADLGAAEAPTLGLCLSGGGFRAALYALGALRYLAEAGRLAQVRVVSAVSGGSIAAGMLADRWTALRNAGGTLDAFLTTIDEPFRRTVTTKNLRNAWLRGALLHPRAGRGAALAHTLAEELYEHKGVLDLPPGPQVIFTSTDLAVGRAFRIARDFVGSWDHGYAQPAPKSLELGTSVAASAAFPGSVSVVWLQTKDLGLPQAPPVLSLVDGGVYDNLGLEWFQGWRSAGRRPSSAILPDFVIVVDASGQLATTDKRFSSLRSVFRDLSVQYAQTLNLRVRWFIDKLLSGQGLDGLQGAYIGIRHDPRKYKDVQGNPVDSSFYAGALPSDLVEPLALLRTDLDRFLPEEADLLSYHAYWSLHARLKTVASDLAIARPAWQPSAYTDMTEAEKKRLITLLQRGAKRALSR
jgi:NTE family protein